MKFYSNNHSFSACQLRFCEAVQTRHGLTCIYAFAVHCFKEVCSQYMDTILLLRFDETYESTFRRLHYAKPFSYVHLTVSSTKWRGKIFSLLFIEGNFSKKLNKDITAIVCIKTFASTEIVYYRENSLNIFFLSKHFKHKFFWNITVILIKFADWNIHSNLASSAFIILTFQSITLCLEYVWDIKWRLSRYDRGDNQSFTEDCITVVALIGRRNKA